MKLDGPNDPIFKGFNPNDRFESQLITATPEGLAGTPLNAIHDVIGGQAALNAVNIARITGGRIALDFGIPDWAVTAVKQIFEVASLVRSGAELLAATSELANDLGRALVESYTAIPIVGVIVDLALAVVDLVKLAIQASKDKQPPPDQALAYHKEGDEATMLAALSTFNTGDWTEIFLPCSTDPAWINESIEYAPGFLGQGQRFAVAGWEGGCTGGYGCLPGLAEQVSVYEYPNEMPPGLGGFGGATVSGAFGKQSGGRGSPLTPITTAGTLHPSVRDLALTLWQMAMRPSVSTFAIRTAPIRSGWRDYFRSMRQWRTTPGGPGGQLSWQILREATASQVVWVPGDNKVELTGQARFYKPPEKPGRSGAPMDLEKLGVTGPDFPMEALIDAFVGQLERRQRYALGTIVCAYVDPEAPALRADGDLAARHSEMRRRLLEHPARCDVELDLIPDAAYRSEMHVATLGCGGGGAFKAKGDGAHRAAPPLDPEGGEEPPPPDQGSPVGGGSGGGSGDGTTELLIAAAILGGLLVA